MLKHWRLSLFLPAYVVLAALAFKAGAVFGLPTAWNLDQAFIAFTLPYGLMYLYWLEALAWAGLVPSYDFKSIPAPDLWDVSGIAAIGGFVLHGALFALPRRWARPRHPIPLFLALCIAASLLVYGLIFWR